MSPSGPGAAPRAVDWPRVLVWFMRAAALVWLAKGLTSWAAILGFGPVPFEAMPARAQARLVALALADPVAAVGLWLVAGWGGALWLLVVVVEVALTLLAPGALPGSLVALAPEFAIVAVFVVLTTLAARAEGEG